VLGNVTGNPVRIHCSGRTDSGVHARAQVAHVDLEAVSFPGKLQRSMNALLESDIRIMHLRRVRADFHARYDAVGKEYRYYIWNGPVLAPFLARYRLHVRHRLDTDHMQHAASLLVGEHDFAAFSANPNREIDGTCRILYGLDIRRRGHEIMITARGNGFLYKMVRSLAGYLVRVGSGALPPESAQSILASRIRTARVPTAAGKGLFLWRVQY
jgi:tRNA pseudouridine38-40 synthase